MSVQNSITTLAALLAFSFTLAAQSPTARVVGTVTDESEAAIPGAVVSLLSAEREHGRQN